VVHAKALLVRSNSKIAAPVKNTAATKVAARRCIRPFVNVPLTTLADGFFRGI
jgi:hypothetical protein